MERCTVIDRLVLKAGVPNHFKVVGVTLHGGVPNRIELGEIIIELEILELHSRLRYVNSWLALFRV